MSTKSQIVIIENNVYRLITLKHFIASEFRIDARLSCADSMEEAEGLLQGIKSVNVIFQTRNGFEDLIAILRRKKVNRLNSDIVLLATRVETKPTELLLTSAKADRPRLVA